tara:strand:- start:2293 stop:3294 length:1002 start_codon:yes stop_codon:yes gene_type:complete
MILKSYETNKKNIENYRFFLLYGDNEGLKEELSDIINNCFEGSKFKYEESEIIKNKDQFNNSIRNKSLFENKKIVTISRCSEKISETIYDIIEDNIKDIIIIINCGILEKKSKLRNFFEKSKISIIIPTYKDTSKSLINIATKFFNERKISLSHETINLLINRSNGDRGNLKSELDKISNYIVGKKNISLKEIYTLTNLSENYSASELADSSLSKNKKKTIEILNENNYATEDCFLILRIFLQKIKKIINLLEIKKNERDIDKIISQYKPPIFWKDKPIVKKQMSLWTDKKLYELITKINLLEVNIKMNNSISIILMQNFIYELLEFETNNSA